MLNFLPLLGINLSILGKRNPLTKSSRFYRESKLAIAELNHGNLVTLQPQLIQTSRLLAANSPDRFHHSNHQSDIGWDNWQPIDRSADRDNFDYKVDRSRFNVEARSSQTSKLEHPELDFFTTVLPTEFAEIDPRLDSLATNLFDPEIPTLTDKQQSIAVDVQPQFLEKLQSKSIEPDRSSSDLVQVNQIERPKLSAQAPRSPTNIQPVQIPQTFSEVGGEITPESESLIALPSDSFVLASADNLLTEPLRETSSFATEAGIDFDSDTPESPAPNLTQISRFADETTSNLVSLSELSHVPIAPNLLDVPTIVNPLTSPKVTPVDPAVTRDIVPESALAPEILTQVTVPEQTIKTTEITPIPESSDRLTLVDSIAPNPLNSPTIIDSQQPRSITTQPTLLEQQSAATENIPSVMPLTVEPMSESISDTPSVNQSNSPTINQSPSTDTSQMSASLADLEIANLDAPALPSNLTSTTSPLSPDLGQISPAPDRISPEIQFPQLLNPATTQLNLAADGSNIDRDLDSIQLEPANLNISESPRVLPVANPEQIATSPIPIEADLHSTQRLETSTSQIDSSDLTSINQTPSALEQISTFIDEPTPVNLESSPTPIIESAHTLSAAALSLAESHLPWRINREPDLTIESTPKLNVDSPQLNVDRSVVGNTPTTSEKIIEVVQENTIETDNEFCAEGLLLTPHQPIIDSHQNTNQTKHLPIDVTNRSDSIVSPVDNLINDLTNVIGLDPVITELPEIDLNDDNSTDITIPTPTVGYATGGYVKDANHIDLQSIATSDTVSAMLTPGEFVINAKDAQKNLDLLTHINRGGEPEAALPNPEDQPSIIEKSSISSDISPTSIQRKRNNSLVAPSLQREVSLQQLLPLTNPGLDTFEFSQAESSNSAPKYSSPLMVFRKPMSSFQSQYTGSDTPDQWGSIEDLISGSSNNSDPFSFDRISSQQPDLEPGSSPIISPQYTSPTRGFADGGEVTPSDISTTIEPITQTIESPLVNPQSQPANNDPAELEILAREIYHRLRQRLEIERERHGSYSGNLAW